jgi:hypothetical protein
LSPETVLRKGKTLNLKKKTPLVTACFPELKTPAERTMMTAFDHAGPPLVDQSVLERLRDDLDADGGYCRIFVGHFIDYLPRRIGRLRLALTTGDLDASVDAVLSLKTSSQMVGAEQLANLAIALEGEIRTEAHDADVAVVLPRLAASFLQPINKCSRLTMHRLQAQCSPGANL